MRTTPFAVLATALWAAGPQVRAAAAPFQIRTDISAAPDTAVYAEQSKALCEEWYPKINEILYGPAHLLPYSEVVIVFQRQKIVGFTTNNVIHVSSDWLKQHHERDFPGLVIHELAHVTQEYVNFHPRHNNHLLALVWPLRIKLSQEWRMNWLAEGIADYVRHKYYEKDLEPRLRLEKHNSRLARNGYRQGYNVAAAFLLWLETRKDKDIVRKLDAVLEQRRYSAKIFKQNCGASLDKLWREFMIQSQMQSDDR